MKLQDDIKEYMTILALRSKSPKTIRTYRRILGDYLKYCQENNYEQQDKETILEYKQYLEDPDKQLSSNTLKLIYSCLRQFYKSMAMIGRCEHIALARQCRRHTLVADSGNLIIGIDSVRNLIIIQFC